MATPTGTKVDAQRARLCAEGYTEAEISQILINQASGVGSQSPAGAAPVQGNMTGVLGNASAALSHAWGTIRSLKDEVADLFNPDASRTSRAKSAVLLACAAVLLLVLGYGIYQEWQQHIMSQTQIAASQAEKLRAETCSAKMKLLTENMYIEDFNEGGKTVKAGSRSARMIEQYNKDCGTVTGDAPEISSPDAAGPSKGLAAALDTYVKSYQTIKNAAMELKTPVKFNDQLAAIQASCLIGVRTLHGFSIRR